MNKAKYRQARVCMCVHLLTRDRLVGRRLEVLGDSGIALLRVHCCVLDARVAASLNIADHRGRRSICGIAVLRLRWVVVRAVLIVVVASPCVHHMSIFRSFRVHPSRVRRRRIRRPTADITVVSSGSNFTRIGSRRTVAVLYRCIIWRGGVAAVASGTASFRHRNAHSGSTRQVGRWVAWV
jgi:hypothetical protein